MEDPRCRIAAKRPEDLGIRHLGEIIHVAVDIEYMRYDTPHSHNCSQRYDNALEFEDPRCQRTVALTEDPRCAGLGIYW